ncbi:MAG: winged helix-turn-helix transcriptional regulator [Mycobacteriaceae bacterium]
MTKASIPTPGLPVRGSNTGKPLMAVFDLLGRRWVMRIVWDLRNGPLGFRQLRRNMDQLSPSVLSSRLSELRSVHILSVTEDGKYQLTKLGMELFASLGPLQDWSDKWALCLAAHKGQGKEEPNE